MKQLLTISIFLLLNTGSVVLAADDVEIKNLLDIKISDWNNDGSVDKAVLSLPSKGKDGDEDEDAALYIFLSNDEIDTSLTCDDSESNNTNEGTIIEKRNIAWTGNMWGTIPELSINKVGSLVVHSMNEAVGRNRWVKQLTISYRNKEFVISGYTYTSHDTLKEDSAFKCDVNFLTGKGFRNEEPFEIDTKIVTLQDWSEQKIPKQCSE